MLKNIDQWVEARPDLYPRGRNSFDWRWRIHKRRYVEGGAVLIVGGQRMVNPAAAEAVEMDLAREEAHALLAREGAAG